MAKPWQKVIVSDFRIKNPDWEPDRPSATVKFQGREVDLDVSDRRTVTDDDVRWFEAALESWEDQIGTVAEETEEYLQRFLPGRKISPEEIALSSVSVYGKEQAKGCTFLLKVEGEYDNPSYDLDQFDHRSFVEFQFPFVDGKLDWKNFSHDVVNDFD